MVFDFNSILFVQDFFDCPGSFVLLYEFEKSIIMGALSFVLCGHFRMGERVKSFTEC